MQVELGADRDTARHIRCTLVGIGISVALIVLGISAAEAQSANAGPSTSAGLDTIAVGGNEAAAGSTPLFVAQKLGYFKDVGLDVKYVTLGGGAAPMSAALRSGDLDVAVAGALQYMTDISRGVIVGKIVGELTDANGVHFVARNGITDIKQIKGKVFGISSYGGGDHVYAQAVLGYYGLGPDDVTFLPIGVAASRMAAMATGKIDATTVAEFALPVGGLPDSVKIILRGEDNPVPFVSGAIFAGQAALTSKKPALERFLVALGKGADWTRAHPDDAVPICQESGATANACKVSIKANMSSQDSYTWSSTTRVNADGIKAMIPLYTQAVPTIKNMTIADFVDTSLVGGAP